MMGSPHTGRNPNLNLLNGKDSTGPRSNRMTMTMKAIAHLSTHRHTQFSNNFTDNPQSNYQNGVKMLAICKVVDVRCIKKSRNCATHFLLSSDRIMSKPTLAAAITCVSINLFLNQNAI
jgi:hypothetical protein